ncbi:MAG: hypothetical protein E6J45_11645, partial [Chloroflexi bacterium]
DSIGGSAGGDLLDFTNLGPPSTVNGIKIDISSTGTQTISTTGQLRLALSSASTIERVNGSNDASYGNDTITGNSLANILRGLQGNDTITGGSGADRLYGGLGNDQFEAADSGTVDSLYGGGGTDTASLLAGDRDSGDVKPDNDILFWA